MTYSKQREDFFNPPSADPTLSHFNDSINVKVKRLHNDAVMPRKAHAGDAGFDLVAAEDTIIEPGETGLIKTGLAFELPPGYEMQIRPRSGITLKTKLRVQFGTVDSNYRGEVGVIVDNISGDYLAKQSGYMTIESMYEFIEKGKVFPKAFTYKIRKGDRIAQAVINRIPSVQITEVDELGDSDRGGGGFGSSGVSSDRTWKEAFDGMVELAKKLRKDANE